MAAWFTWRGRLPRRAFLWWALASVIAFVALFVLVEHSIGYAATLILYPPFFAAWLSLMVRRLHDQGRAAWWLLALLVPALGPVLVGLMLLFRRGSRDGNSYGPDPRLVERDYLQVRIHEPA